MDLREHLVEQTDRPAVFTGEESISYRDLLRRADALAENLRASGAEPGHAIVIDAANAPQTIWAYLACLMHGFAMVPLDPEATEAARAYICNAVRPQAFVALDGTVMAEIPHGARGNTPEASGARHDGIGAIFFTSGSTSEPKGVCHSVAGLLANAAAFNTLTGVDARQRMVHALPMSYMAGFLNTILCPLAAGGSIVLNPRFDARAALNFWDAPMRHNANAAWLTPTMVALLTRINRSDRVPEWAADSLTHVFVGTAPLAPEAGAAFEDTFGVPCLPSYGMTEALLVSGYGPQDLREPGGVGRLVPGTEVGFGSPEASGEIAGEELAVRSAYLFKGYLEPGGIAQDARDQEGWFASGDTAYLSDEGDLHIGERLKNIIIKGGTNISPASIESVIRECEGVREAYVLGVPHPLWGESVVVVVEGSAPEADLEATVRTHALAHLPRALQPDRVVAVAALPRSASGKVARREVLALL